MGKTQFFMNFKKIMLLSNFENNFVGNMTHKHSLHGNVVATMDYFDRPAASTKQAVILAHA